jgi:phosphoadenosine phosphosulfate reductase
MRRILRRRELVPDDWRPLGEEGADAGEPALIVPFPEFRTHIDRWRAYKGRLGVRLSPADAVEDLAEDIQRLALVACEFPTPGEGRGYTQGRILRSRLRFTGELRAVGAAVKQDLLFIMSRCGFDSFELAAGQNVEEALKALDRYTVAYQPAVEVPAIRQQRFFAAG